MKLTKLLRSAIVEAIMADIPETDHQARFEAAVHADVIEHLPEPVAKVYADLALRSYVVGCSWYGGPQRDAEGNWVSAPFSSVALPRDYDLSEEFLKAIEPLVAEKRAHSKQVTDMEAAITGIINSCSTSKQFLERLPEFAKYLPVEPTKSANLPALANLTADLVKLGWPKGGKSSSLAPAI
jgi:hypothetical protein